MLEHGSLNLVVVVVGLYCHMLLPISLSHNVGQPPSHTTGARVGLACSWCIHVVGWGRRPHGCSLT